MRLMAESLSGRLTRALVFLKELSVSILILHITTGYFKFLQLTSVTTGYNRLLKIPLLLKVTTDYYTSQQFTIVWLLL